MRPLLLTLALAGCALTPAANQQLEEGRAAYRNAAADPRVQAYAQPELKSAGDALREAERIAEDSGPSELVEHNAYLAAQRSRAAQRTADKQQAEADIAATREARQRAQLEARDREVQAAREQARAAESRVSALEMENLKVVREKTAAAELAAEVKRLEAELAGVQARQTERGWILTLGNELLFDSGTSLKGHDADRALDNLAEFLRKHPGRDIAIEGFTDSAGPKDSAERLSERRAQALKFALVQRGIEPHRIDARGYGQAFPVASNDNESGRQLNRRVEIVINPS